MVESSIGRHILWEEERLFESLGHQTSMPPAIMPKSGIKRDWHTINLQHGRPSTHGPAYLGHWRFLLIFHRTRPSVPMVLCLPGLLTPFGRAQFSFFSSFGVPFPPQI